MIIRVINFAKVSCLCGSHLWQSVAIYSPRSPEGGQVGKRDFYDNSQNALTKKLQKLLIIRVINFAKVSCLCGSHLWQSVAIYSPRSPEGGQVGKRDFYDNSQNALTKKLQKLLIIRVINFAKVSCLCGSHLWQSVAMQK